MIIQDMKRKKNYKIFLKLTSPNANNYLTGLTLATRLNYQTIQDSFCTGGIDPLRRSKFENGFSIFFMLDPTTTSAGSWSCWPQANTDKMPQAFWRWGTLFPNVLRMQHVVKANDGVVFTYKFWRAIASRRTFTGSANISLADSYKLVESNIRSKVDVESLKYFRSSTGF